MTYRYGALILGISTIMGIGYIFSNEQFTPSNNSSRTNSDTTSEIVVYQGPIATEIQLDVPLLNQMDYPRLYNGCEVSSLAMILYYKGIEVTKNELANEIARVPLTYSNGENGNPHFGFVGNMEDGPGLGVYHEPIFSLAKQYVGDRVEDLTNQDFDLIHKKVAEENPIWVITTSTFEYTNLAYATRFSEHHL